MLAGPGEPWEARASSTHLATAIFSINIGPAWHSSPTKGWAGEWVDGEAVGGYMDGQLSGQMAGYLDERMGRWLERRVNYMAD